MQQWLVDKSAEATTPARCPGIVDLTHTRVTNDAFFLTKREKVRAGRGFPPVLPVFLREVNTLPGCLPRREGS